MKNIFKTGALIFLFAGSMANAADVPFTALTKSCKPIVDKNLKVPQPPIKGLDERTHKRISRAQERMADSKYGEGIAILKKLAESARNDYVRATVYIQLAYAHAQQGKQMEAFPYFQKALQFGENQLPHDNVQSLRENVAGFMYTQGKKKQALAMMKTWMKKSNVDKPTAYYLFSALYADPDVNQQRKAVCPAYFAVKSERKPKKSYFQLLLALHWELKDIKGSATILKSMIEYFPKEKTFWRQLSQIYMQLDKVNDALAIMEMFYLRNEFETDMDYKFLSSLFSYTDIPYRSAKILEEGLDKGIVKAEMKNWRAVAQNYHVSNELKKAIKAYGKTAEISDDGKAFLKQAELYSDIESWAKSVKSFDKALKKGGLDDLGRVHMRKGIALMNMNKCDSAIKALDQAAKFKKYRKQSGQWKSYVNMKKQRNKC